MALLDAQGTTFSFDGISVGRVRQYEVRDGIVRSPEARILNSNAVQARPGLATSGSVILDVYLDLADAGIQRIQQAFLASPGEIVDFTVTTQDGNGFSAEVFVTNFPYSGALDTTQTSRIALRIAGTVTPL